VDVVARRFDVVLVPLDPVRGKEMQKTRPCVIVSPDEVNQVVQTVLIAPLTSVFRKYQFRPTCTFAGRPGQVALDQIRVVDRTRLLKNIGRLTPAEQATVTKTLVEMFR
jgi:mRNA interferase MazF